MERLKQDSSSNFQKMTKGDIHAVFRVNSSGVGDDMITHEPSVTARSSFMNIGLSTRADSLQIGNNVAFLAVDGQVEGSVTLPARQRVSCMRRQRGLQGAGGGTCL